MPLVQKPSIQQKNNILHGEILYNLFFVKNIVKALRNEESTVDVYVKDFMPIPPKTKYYTLHTDKLTNKITWMYLDPWTKTTTEMLNSNDIESMAFDEFLILKEFLFNKLEPYLKNKNNEKKTTIPLFQAIVLLTEREKIRNPQKNIFNSLKKLSKRTDLRLWKSNLTGQIEINYGNFTETIFYKERNEIIPQRLFKNKLIIKCKCCYNNYWNEVIPKFDPIKNKEQLDHIFKAKHELIKQPINYKIKTSNKITEKIQELLCEAFKKKEEKQQEPPLLLPLTSFLDDSDLIEDRRAIPVCRSCLEEKFPIHYSGSFRNKLNEPENKYIGNYTDNPLSIYPGFLFGNRETPIFAIKEQKRIIGYEANNISKPILQISLVEKDITLYMGIELEVTPSNSIAKKIAQRLNCRIIDCEKETKIFTAKLISEFMKQEKIGIIKRDASVKTGFEIVSIPGTHKWHTEIAWNKFFKENYQEEEQELAPSSFLVGWANNGPENKMPICGIHIHISRDSLTPLQFGKIWTFMNEPDNEPFLEKIAGRRSDRYAKFSKKKISDGRILKYNRGNYPDNVTALLAINGDGYHHHALNVNTGDKKTIEFRIFRSNVARDGFMKNIDFVHALVTWCNIASINELNPWTFMEWVKQNRGTYKYLYKWQLKQEGKYKINPEFINKKIIDIQTGKPELIKIPNPGYQPEHEEAA